MCGLLAACHQQPAAAPSPMRSPSDSSAKVSVGVVGIPMGRPRSDVEHFVPAFPAADSGGTCGYLPAAALQNGEWAANLTFPAGSRAARRVTVRFNTSGDLTYYSDRRGEISLGRVVRQSDGTMRVDVPAGRRTEIDINLVTGAAIARNAGGGAPEESFIGEAAQMLDAENLDYPRKTAAMIRERCR
jgi:hypothetical protein